ncbi:MAG: type II toxin-antitoxin system VapC family toxin [Cyanobium sp.]
MRCSTTSEPGGFLVDPHLLLWWASMPEQRPESARSRLASTDHPVLFSLVSPWEVVIQASLGRDDVQVNSAALRRGLLLEGFREPPIQVGHGLAVQHLPRIHRDPFDWLLVAQASREGLSLLAYRAAVRWSS